MSPSKNFTDYKYNHAEAFQFTGGLSNAVEILNWMRDVGAGWSGNWEHGGSEQMEIYPSETGGSTVGVYVEPGNWIVFQDGAFFVLEDEEFSRKYEEI